MKEQDVHSGGGAFEKVASILDELSAKSVFLVSDEPAYEASGAAAELEPLLTDRRIERFLGFEPNPKLKDVERGIGQFKSSKPDVVISVGGGTAIDLAKLIGTLAEQSAEPRDIISGKASIERNGVPIIVIPTTAGTGSEATHFAVAYIEGQKYSVADSTLLPDFVLLEPKLTHSLPAGITAATGLDAFCQSVESIWAVGGTNKSVGYASEAASLIVDHFADCVQNPTPTSRAAMCQAAHLSGKAINISKTTAPHAISYAITTRFGVPHGMAVALTLGSLLQFNAEVCQEDCADSRGPEYVKKRIAQIIGILGKRTPVEGVDLISSIMKSAGAPLSLRDAGIHKKEEIAWIAEQVNVERLSNNPRRVAKPDIEKILADIRQ